MMKINQVNKRRHLSLITAFIFIAISVIVYYVVIRPQQKYFYTHHVNIHGIYLINPIEVGNLELIDNHGNHFTKDNLKNHWSFLFFGFTHCQMVCPLTMNVLHRMYQTLQSTLPIQDLPQVIFISIDPESDSIKNINQFVASFDSHFIGARTTIEKTAALENEFHVIANKVQTTDPNQYTMNHSPEILLINPHAQIQAYFSYPPQTAQMIKDYYSIINKSKT